MSSVTSSVSSKLPQQFQLREHQQEWANEAFEILKNHYFYIDTSQPRSGKSYLALWIAKQANLPVFIVAPRSSHGSWKKALQTVRVYHEALMTYQAFAGTVEGVNHPYLVSHTVIVKGNKEAVYSASAKFRKLVKEGVLVIFDEMHNLKNDCGFSRAAAALTRVIVESDSPATRCALLSATPFDQMEHATVLLRTLGITSTCHLLDNILGTITYKGLREALDYFEFLDEAKTRALVEQYPVTSHAHAERLVFHLYVEILKPQICGSMALPTDVQSRMDFTNTFFVISEDHHDAVLHALNTLNRVVEDIEQKHLSPKSPSNPGQHVMQAINEAMYLVEKAKLYDMNRIAQYVLESRPNMKVVIALQGLESMEIMVQHLACYNARLIHGQVDPDTRTALAHEFNTDPNVRAMIVNLNLCEGFSLYAENVEEDRLLLISPSFRFISIIQTAGRICGTDMIGKAYIKMFYADIGDEGQGEKNNVDRIYNLNIDKSNVMEQALDERVRAALVLPNKYRDETEDECAVAFAPLEDGTSEVIEEEQPQDVDLAEAVTIEEEPQETYQEPAPEEGAPVPVLIDYFNRRNPITAFHAQPEESSTYHDRVEELN